MKKTLSSKVLKKLKLIKFLGLNLLIWFIIAAALLIIILFAGKSVNDNAPRIMYWPGKVNQHFDLVSKTWLTDPDGFSGAEISMIVYCQKFYPKTQSVKEYKNESIDTWHSVGNQGQYSAVKPSYLCLEK